MPAAGSHQKAEAADAALCAARGVRRPLQCTAARPLESLGRLHSLYLERVAFGCRELYSLYLYVIMYPHRLFSWSAA
jgi:hypothetical protein